MKDAWIPLIPIGSTVKDSYQLTARNFLVFAKYAWPWLIALTLAMSALYQLFYPFVRAAAEKAGSTEIVNMFTATANLAFGAGIAVPWHRLFLLGERPGYSFDRSKIVRYFVIALALYLPLVVLNFAATYFGETGEPNGESSIGDRALLITIALFFALTLGIIRAGLILPAIAVGRQKLTLGEVWKTTERNTLRLGTICFLTTFPIFVLFTAVFIVSYPTMFAEMAADGMITRSTYVIQNVAFDLVGAIIGLFGLTSLSLSYRHFFPTPVDGSADQSAAKQ